MTNRLVIGILLSCCFFKAAAQITFKKLVNLNAGIELFTNSSNYLGTSENLKRKTSPIVAPFVSISLSPEEIKWQAYLSGSIGLNTIRYRSHVASNLLATFPYIDYRYNPYTTSLHIGYKVTPPISINIGLSINGALNSKRQNINDTENDTEDISTYFTPSILANYSITKYIDLGAVIDASIQEIEISNAPLYVANVRPLFLRLRMSYRFF